MEAETEFMKNLLPGHYTCEQRENGVHCYSEIGIDEDDPEQWDFTMKAIRQKFGKRLMEVFHQTCTNHVRFTVYLRPSEVNFIDCNPSLSNNGTILEKHKEGEIAVCGYPNCKCLEIAEEEFGGHVKNFPCRKVANKPPLTLKPNFKS